MGINAASNQDQPNDDEYVQLPVPFPGLRGVNDIV